MSTATQVQAEAGSNSGNAAPTFEQQVNEAVANATRTADGKRQLPEGLSEELRFAANAELRRRDTESALSKARHQLKVQEVTTAELKKYAASSIPASISPEMQRELEEMKYADPDGWRRKVNELEQSAAVSISKHVEGIALTASQQIELENRQRQLDEYNKANPDFALNDDVLANDLPPKLVRQLDTGEIDFAGFLHEAKKYLSTSTVVGGGVVVEKEPNLGRIGGGATPSQADRAGQFEDSYAKITF